MYRRVVLLSLIPMIAAGPMSSEEPGRGLFRVDSSAAQAHQRPSDISYPPMMGASALRARTGFLTPATETGRRNLVPNAEFNADTTDKPVGWTFRSPRPAIAPEADIVTGQNGNFLRMKATRFACYGKWTTVARNVRPEETYRFDVLYKPQDVEKEDVSVAAILSWCKDNHGETPIQRDYADRVSQADGWRRLSRTLQAPKDAQSVRVELVLRWTDRGSVLFSGPELVAVKPPTHRAIRVAATHVKPSYPATVEKNLKLMSDILDKAGAEKPDIVCLSENFVDRGVNLPLTETAQTIPGPATGILCEKAKHYNTYVVTTLHELDGDLIYNTAVLINRQGEIVGKYRKVHLATAEGENGVTPGSDHPVFDTDFGRIGILTCWDNWFVEPARILRLKGAEMLIFPCAGDGTPRHYDVIWRARAIDNGVYFVSSTTVGDAPSRIIDPTGEVLAETAEAFGIALAEIDLDKESRVYWLSVGPSYGEAKSLYIKERRPDTYDILTEDVIERGK